MKTNPLSLLPDKMRRYYAWINLPVYLFALSATIYVAQHSLLHGFEFSLTSSSAESYSEPDPFESNAKELRAQQMAEQSRSQVRKAKRTLLNVMSAGSLNRVVYDLDEKTYSMEFNGLIHNFSFQDVGVSEYKIAFGPDGLVIGYILAKLEDGDYSVRVFKAEDDVLLRRFKTDGENLKVYDPDQSGEMKITWRAKLKPDENAFNVYNSSGTRVAKGKIKNGRYVCRDTGKTVVARYDQFEMGDVEQFNELFARSVYCLPIRGETKAAMALLFMLYPLP
ncbi:MAG: hypothetical protein HRT45_15770 [Bdellovibrionales bacterium]|nr:hypothetical protein [Bdellovibrionales bacterium]